MPLSASARIEPRPVVLVLGSGSGVVHAAQAAQSIVAGQASKEDAELDIPVNHTSAMLNVSR